MSLLPDINQRLFQWAQENRHLHAIDMMKYESASEVIEEKQNLLNACESCDGQRLMYYTFR